MFRKLGKSQQSVNIYFERGAISNPRRCHGTRCWARAWGVWWRRARRGDAPLSTPAWGAGSLRRRGAHSQSVAALLRYQLQRTASVQLPCDPGKFPIRLFNRSVQRNWSAWTTACVVRTARRSRTGRGWLGPAPGTSRGWSYRLDAVIEAISNYCAHSADLGLKR